jgi:uracil-DNA glycosylase
MNQRPLLDHVAQADVMWVGLSAKRVVDPAISVPLDTDTNSGRLIAEIEGLFPHVRFYKTNLVKCLPLSEEGKLRYPTVVECSACVPNLDLELDLVNPKVVFLLGAKVAKCILSRLDTDTAKASTNYSVIEYQGRFFVPIPHPSFIMAYRRKSKVDYVERVRGLIARLLQE